MIFIFSHKTEILFLRLPFLHNPLNLLFFFRKCLLCIWVSIKMYVWKIYTHNYGILDRISRRLKSRSWIWVCTKHLTPVQWQLCCHHILQNNTGDSCCTVWSFWRLPSNYPPSYTVDRCFYHLVCLINWNLNISQEEETLCILHNHSVMCFMLRLQGNEVTLPAQQMSMHITPYTFKKIR